MSAAPAARAAGPDAADAPDAAARVFLSSLIRPGPLVVAVSGGGDSLALLHALHRAGESAPGLRRQLVAVTVDHRLRPASADEARFVTDVCSGLGVPHRILSWQGEKPATGLQEAARDARYRLLADAARLAGAVGIVTAHTADDQVETVAMRAGRTGATGFTAGLAGMAPATLFRQSVWILRPFLTLQRAALRHFLRGLGQSWIDDPSNADPAFERARVRSGGASVDLGAVAAAQAERRRRAEAAAAAIAEQAAFHPAGLVRMRLDGLAPDDAGALLAVRTLAALVGGRPYRPGQAPSLRLAGLLAGPGARMTVARAVAERRSGALFLHRERRSLPVERLVPGEAGLWDGRYRLRNAGEVPLVARPPTPAEVEEVAVEAADAWFPASLLRRALAAEPVLEGDSGGAGILASREGGDARHFALFDLFLPCFDLKLAERSATLFGRQGYGRPPLASPD